MKKSVMTAKTLRGILIFSIFLMIAGSTVGTYFAQKWLLSQAETISQTVAESNASGNNNQAAAKLQAELTAQQSVITKTSLLAVPRQEYQSKAIQELDQYAADAGISISNYSFSQAAAVAATGTTTATSAAATAASNNPIVTATLTSPVSYGKLLKFMNYVENNLPKMQIASVNLGRATGASGDSAKIDQLSIEVSVN